MADSREDTLVMLINAKVHEVRLLRSDYETPRLLDEEIANLRSQISALQIKLDKVLYRKENLRELLCSAVEQLRDARTELLTLKNSDKIAKLKMLDEQIRAMEKDGAE